MRNSMVECQTVNLKVVGSNPTLAVFLKKYLTS